KLLPMLLYQTAKIYEAKTVQDFHAIVSSLGQIRGAIKGYERKIRSRTYARLLGVIIPIAAYVAIGYLVYAGLNGNGPNVNTVLPVIDLPLPILLWSAIGSFTAILYRFNKSGDIELQDPLRWLITRPITGIILGTISYFVVLI